MSVIFVLVVTFLAFAFPSFAQELVITNFSSDSKPEWVEIHNPTQNPVSLDGWKITDSNDDEADDIFLSGCLSPNSYLTSFKQNGGWLNDTGDTIDLFRPDGNVVSELEYSDGESRYASDYRNTNTCVPSPTQTPTSTPVPTATTAPASPTPSTSPAPSSTPVPTNTTIPTPTGTITLTFVSTPESVRVGDEFTLSFKAVNLVTDQDYYFKVIGGLNAKDSYDFQTKNNNTWYYYNSDWASLPKFKATSSQITASVIARIKPDSPLGNYSVYLKIQQGNETSARTIRALAGPTSTPTPTPTTPPAPTSTRSPTSTPVPSLVVPTSLPSLNPADLTTTPVPTIDLSVYSASTSPETPQLGDLIIGSPTPGGRFQIGSVSAIIPYAVIGFGSVLLLVPVLVSKFLK